MSKDGIKVSYVTTGNESIASFRYRVFSPASTLRQLGCLTQIDRKARPDADFVVFGKHWQYNDWSYAYFCKLRGQRVVFDVCDDHFKGKHESHYRRMCDVAHLVTCNSIEMHEVILEATGRVAEVIPDPVLSPLRPYDKQKRHSLLWYGQGQNFQGLVDTYRPEDGELEIVLPNGIIPPKEMQVNPSIKYTQWHPKVIEAAAERNSVALLPYRQGKPAKSANRVLEALNSGLPVLTDRLPAVVTVVEEALCEGAITFLDGRSVQESLEEMYSVGLDSAMERAQGYIQHNYSEIAVATLWKEALECA